MQCIRTADLPPVARDYLRRLNREPVTSDEAFSPPLEARRSFARVSSVGQFRGEDGGWEFERKAVA